MMTNQLLGLLCPHCGLLFFSSVDGMIHCCPDCRRHFASDRGELLEAYLSTDDSLSDVKNPFLTVSADLSFGQEGIPARSSENPQRLYDRE